MKKTRFTETQIARALKEGEEGRKTEDICRAGDQENDGFLLEKPFGIRTKCLQCRWFIYAYVFR